jgi:hypothetical protein
VGLWRDAHRVRGHARGGFHRCGVRALHGHTPWHCRLHVRSARVHLGTAKAMVSLVLPCPFQVITAKPSPPSSPGERHVCNERGHRRAGLTQRELGTGAGLGGAAGRKVRGGEGRARAAAVRGTGRAARGALLRTGSGGLPLLGACRGFAPLEHVPMIGSPRPQ